MKRVHGLVCGGVEMFVGCVVFVMERDRTERRLTKVEQKKDEIMMKNEIER